MDTLSQNDGHLDNIPIHAFLPPGKSFSIIAVRYDSAKIKE